MVIDVSPRPPSPGIEHLGDGVYVSYDGYNINIAVNHHANHVVALEPSVLHELFDYVKRTGVMR